MHTWQARRSAWVLVLALVAALPASVALGIAKVGSVRVAGDAAGSDAGEVYTAAEGTKSVFARFEYTGASRTDITVRVVANSLKVFESTKSYNGDDTASVEITGQAIYKTALESLSTYSDQLIREVNGLTGGNDLVGGEALQYITSIESFKNQIEIGLPLLASLELDGQSERAFANISDDLEDIATNIASAQALPADDTAGRQDYGRDIKPLAERIDSSLEDIAEFVDDLGSVALPATGTEWSFDVSVRTSTSSGNSAAGSARFMVDGTASKSEDEPDEPTARPSATSRGGVASDTDRGGATSTPRAQATTAASGAGGKSNNATSPTARSNASVQSAVAGSNAAAPGDDGADGAEAAPDDASASGAPDTADTPAADSPADEQVAMVDNNAQPTWTVPAGRAADTSGAAPNEGSEPSSDATPPGNGPNFMVLGLGLVLLVGTALWFRRRA